jgi:hypothetical protein
MVSFRRFALALASLAISAGVVAAQPVTVTAFTPSILRAEGVTELLPTLTFGTNITAAGIYSITVYSSVPVTSAVGEPQMVVTAGDASTTTAAGQVIGTTVVFPSVNAVVGATITLSGIRVNANMLPTLANGAVIGTGENLFVVASPLTAGGDPLFGPNMPTLSIPSVAFAVPTLSVVLPTSASALSNCSVGPFDPTSDTLPASGTYAVTIAELYNGAFKNKAAESDGLILASNGTQFSIAFTNLPTNTTLYVPATIGVAPGFTMSLVSPSASSALANGAVAVPANGIVIYEVTNGTAGLDSATVPVYVSFTGQPVAGALAPAVTVQYAPVSTNPGAANSPIPRFAVSTPVTSSKTFTVKTCNTTLLMPYVVAVSGYDTGLAISNTASDPNATKGSMGACTLYFYGTGAPALPFATPAIAPGATTAVVLSTIAPGFQGYAVAKCDFNYAHGYVFVINGTSHATASYLPLVLGDRPTGSEALNN